MKLYAERPVRFIVQVIVDIAAIGVGVLPARFALDLHDQLQRLRTPGERLVDAGGGLRDTFGSAARQASEVPVVGDKLADALGTGSKVGDQLGDAGRWQIEAVDDLSFWLAIVVFALPVMFLLLTWLPLRLRFAVRAGAAHRLRKLGASGLDLLAMRALVNQPSRRARETASLLERWRESDPDATARLAGMELKRLGLKVR
ncbi:hypothetical protein [Flindersiella endophytica]